MAKIVGFQPWPVPGVNYRTNGREEAYAIARGPYAVGDVSDIIGGTIGAQAVQASWPFIEEKINQKLLVIGVVAAVAYGGLVWLILRRSP